MKRVLKFVGLAVAGLLVVLLAGGAYINWGPTPTYEVAIPDLQVSADSAMIARGEKLVSLSCALCHRGKNSGKLDGRLWHEKDFGTLYTANITNAPDALGTYSDGELARLLRTGVKRNGELALVMPRYTTLSDRDLAAVIAYLRSDAPPVQASDQHWPPHQKNFLAKTLQRVAFKPYPYREGSIADPDPNDEIAQGRYLAHNLSCFLCHSADFATANELEPERSEGYFGGGNLIPSKEQPGKIPAPNLTPHPEYGIGKWTAAELGQAIRNGKRPDGGYLDHAMPLFTSLTDAEVNALWKYLRTVPVIDNEIVR